MPWLTDILAQLSKPEAWSYRAGAPIAVEPTALAALALIGHGRTAEAKPALEKLCEMQTPEGACGIYDHETLPHWPTSYAMLAWTAAVRAIGETHADAARYKSAVVAGGNFLMTIPVTTMHRTGSPDDNIVGHDGSLEGWPWVGGTHSWLEPTALALTALRASGRRALPRCDDAARLLIDRLLPSGGCNYGNTFVLEQVLRPHIQPTGIVMLALAGEQGGDERIAKSLAYLERTVDDKTAAASLSYAVMGLAAHGRSLPNVDALLEASIKKPTFTLGADQPRRALLALAALGDKCPLVQLAREGAGG